MTKLTDSSYSTPSYWGQKYGVWVSVLAHLLALILLSAVWLSNPVDIEKQPNLYIPSYIASQENIIVPSQQQVSLQQTTTSSAKTNDSKVKPTSAVGLEKPIQQKSEKVKSLSFKPVTAPSTNHVARKFQTIESSREEQGVHLIGDEKIDKSLRVILGKAISRYLFYPKNAIEFNVTGTVLVGFTLHPDGQVTNIQLVKPSSAGILNSAALSAINQISPVQGVREYVSEPRFLVVGIIFSGLQT